MVGRTVKNRRMDMLRGSEENTAKLEYSK